MFAGSRFEIKGADLLLKYLKYDVSASITVDVVGNGDALNKINENGDMRIRCIESQPDMNAMYHQYDGFISLSRYETFSYAIAEAMYVGLPIIKSDCLGTNWANENPSVFLARDATEFWQAIENVKIMDENALKQSSKFVEEKYSNDVWCAKVYQIYNEKLE